MLISVLIKEWLRFFLEVINGFVVVDDITSAFEGAVGVLIEGLSEGVAMLLALAISVPMVVPNAVCFVAAASVSIILVRNIFKYALFVRDVNLKTVVATHKSYSPL